jgi:hypothetical protein
MEPAHEEAFIHLPSAQVGEAQGMAVVQAIMNWVADQHRKPAAFMRQIFIRQSSSGGAGLNGPDGSGPACDFALPLAPVGQPS